MTSRIVEHDRPARFVDEQTSGPFKRFRHEHRFEPSDQGTLMIDSIEFDAPAGILGVAVERLVLRRYLRRLISRRNAHLELMAYEPG
jgi:ligand-binding SRPBCC domain-containing protein